MTFSLVAKCEKTNMFGVAIASSSPAVAARCSYTRAGVGAVSSQNVTDPSLGPLTLDLEWRSPSGQIVRQTNFRTGVLNDFIIYSLGKVPFWNFPMEI